MVEGGDLRYKVSMGKGGGTMRGKTFLGNAFSINMVEKFPAKAYFREISIEDVKNIISSGFISAVGHESTSIILTKILGIEIPMNRITITLNNGDNLIVAALNMPRLPENKILQEEELEKIPIKFILVEVFYD